MVYLSEIMDVVLLGQHVKNGLVTSRRHDSLPLAILNYTPECQFSRGWDDVTRKCRGLIYNTVTTEVVARPFEKFGNWDEMGYQYPPSGPALRMEKMDGSLGILYHHDRDGGDNHGHGNLITRSHYIATRGSMHSEQATWATEFYRQSVKEQAFGLDGYNWGQPVFSPKFGKTYLFEIIYPENRIVVDYGEYRGLVLLDVIDNETGFPDTDEFDNCEWPEKVNRQHIPGFDSGQVVDIPQGGEGFVFLWPTRNFRTKMKSAEYIELHKLISNLSEKTVWEALVAGKTKDDIKIGLPEEFHKWVDGVIDEIQGKALEIVKRVNATYSWIDPTLHRGEIARSIKDNPDRKYLFLMLDGKPIYPVALRDSKPVKATASREAME